ncbi:MFS transporter [Paenibacillus koleovorans]|uniref:MFS transporter n=1 Tax=Paenibacillus koleovorans TaxID=121608 RepID=UPI000FD91856|nr:MFS transporter [Paenibacillus koleovorans]
MNRTKLSANVPLFYVYTILNHFILDRAIWMLFLVSKGFSLTQIALLESAYHLMNFLFEVPTGYVADRYGKRASLMVAQGVAMLSSGLLLWGGHGSIVLAGFMLGALVGTFQSGATSALIYETLKQLGREQQFKRYNSHMAAIALVALGVSGVAGGALSDVNWAWVYFGKVVLSLLSLMVVMLLSEPRSVETAAEGLTGETRYSFMKQLHTAYTFARSNRKFLALSVYGALLYAMSWSIAFYSQVVFQSLGLTNGTIGLLNGLETWVSAAVAAVAFLGERWLGKRGSLLLAGVGYIGFLALFSTASTVSLVIPAFFLMAAVISYLEPLLEAYLHELLPSSIRATMLSVFSMLISAGMMVTFTGIGVLADWTMLSTSLKIVLLMWAPVCLAVMGWALKAVRGK